MSQSTRDCMSILYRLRLSGMSRHLLTYIDVILYFCTHLYNSCANVVLHRHQNPTRRSFVRVQAPPLSSAQRSATTAQVTGDLRTALVMSHRVPVSQSLPVQRRRRLERERVGRRGRREMESYRITLLSLTVHQLDLLTPWESQY